MSTTTQETKLLAAIAKQNTLLLAVRDKKHPDFASLSARDVLLQQAQCWLSLARIRRLTAAKTTSPSSSRDAWSSFQLQPTPLDEALLGGVAQCLQHARRLYFDGEVAADKSASQGQVLVLVEEAELLILRGQHTEALARYDDAIQLCNSQGDHATESLVHHKLESLRVDHDTWAKLDQLAQSPQANVGEREILQKCFDQLTIANATGFLRKEQLGYFARELGAQTALSSDEVDEIWRQILAHETARQTSVETDGVGFSALWRWWMAEEMYEFRSHNTRRH